MGNAIRWDRLPETGLELVRRLNQAGFEAWFVGGCVRDLLLGDTPHDWDICTSALPAETEAVLAEFTVHETGIRHGTVLVVNGGDGYEITTFRTETAYTDHRHPDSVRFVRDLASDLARRDFTINAMACHPQHGLVDLFGGREDLERGVIRAVGQADARFQEDALRILRALRFAGRFSFSIEPTTAEAVHARRQDLKLIAAERIFSELKGILCAPGAAALLLEYADVFGVVLPEVVPLFGYDQNNPHHDADGWRHTVRVVSGVPAEPVLRLAALFHDTGKPDCCTRDAAGVSHFYGHERRSRELAHQALHRLKCDNETRTAVETLVELHDCDLPATMPQTRRFLTRVSLPTARRLLLLRRADVLGQSPYQRERKLRQLDDFAALLDQAAAEGLCCSLEQLALRGSDLVALGIAPGPEIGRRLRLALNAVLDGEAPNERAALLAWLREHDAP